MSVCVGLSVCGAHILYMDPHMHTHNGCDGGMELLLTVTLLILVEYNSAVYRSYDQSLCFSGWDP